MSRREPWIPAAVALLAFFAFLPVLDNDLVDWDDILNLTENYHFRGLSWRQIRWAFNTFHVGVYQPVSWLLFEFQYVLFGLRPWGYHLVSLLWHAANMALLCAVSRRIITRAAPDWFEPAPLQRSLAVGVVVALFAVHPLRTEAVAWASCQPYLPSIFFFQCALLAYLRADQGPRRRWLAATFFLFLLALLAKAVAMTLPLVLLLLDVYPLRRFTRRQAWRVVAEKIPFLLLSALFARWAASAKENIIASWEQAGPSVRVAQASYGTVFYLIKTVWPVRLATYYSMPDRLELTTPLFLLCALAVVATTALVLWRARRWPQIAAAWLAYLILLAPNSGLVRFGAQLCADRYGYLATMPLVVLAAAGLGKLVSGRAGRMGVELGGLAGAALVALMMVSWVQCTVWHDTVAVWENALENGGPAHGEIHGWLGSALRDAGRFEEAEREFSIGLKMSSDNPSIWNNYGVLLGSMRRNGEALFLFRKAIQLKPKMVEAHNNLGNAHLLLGQQAPALAEFAESERLDPSQGQVHIFRGRVYLNRGDPASAVREFQRALQLNPYLDEARERLQKLSPSPAQS